MNILTEEELKELVKDVIVLKGLKIRSSMDLINSHLDLFKEYDLYKTIALEFVTEQTARKIYALLRSGQ